MKTLLRIDDSVYEYLDQYLNEHVQRAWEDCRVPLKKSANFPLDAIQDLFREAYKLGFEAGCNSACKVIQKDLLERHRICLKFLDNE